MLYFNLKCLHPLFNKRISKKKKINVKRKIIDFNLGVLTFTKELSCFEKSKIKANNH